MADVLTINSSKRILRFQIKVLYDIGGQGKVGGTEQRQPLEKDGGERGLPLTGRSRKK